MFDLTNFTEQSVFVMKWRDFSLALKICGVMELSVLLISAHVASATQVLFIIFDFLKHWQF